MKALHLVAALTLATAGGAQAQETQAADPEGASATPAAPGTAVFGRAGQVVISGELQAGFLHTTFTPGAESGNVFVFQPAADWFVARNISLGGFLTLTHTDPMGRSPSTVFGIAARGGYNLAISRPVTIWPTLSVGYAHTTANGGGSLVPVEAFVPFLFHIDDCLFIGLGPVFRRDLHSNGGSMNGLRRTDVGVISVVGGYFGG